MNTHKKIILGFISLLFISIFPKFAYSNNLKNCTDVNGYYLLNSSKNIAGIVIKRQVNCKIDSKHVIGNIIQLLPENLNQDERIQLLKDIKNLNYNIEYAAALDNIISTRGLSVQVTLETIKVFKFNTINLTEGGKVTFL